MRFLAVLPFLLLAMLVLPLLTWQSLRRLKLHADHDEAMPSTRTLALQSMGLQVVMFSTAWLAAWGNGINITWSGGWTAMVALLALGVLATGLVFASLEARRPLTSSDRLRQHLRQVGAKDPYWVVAVAMAAIAEEYCYRGVLTTLLSSAIGTLGAVLASAVLFGAAHLGQGWHSGLFSAMFGLCLQALCYAQGGILAAIIVHFAYDMIVIAAGRRRWECDHIAHS
ncbi:CPBP family intramembrane glutamic endopeptidase [Pseudoxanthomonas mexicana]